MENLYVVYEEEIIEEYRSPERYGSWYEKKRNHLKYVTTEKPELDPYNYVYFDTINWIDDEDPKKGDDIFVVYATYVAGNSMGEEEGVLELVIATSSKETAEKWREAVEESSNNGVIEVEHNGKTITLSAPWGGMFDVFTDAFVASIPFIG